MQGAPALRRAAAVAALAGFACMAAELTAVRLLAPHFGDSAYVWTNVIGVILAALAVGAWFGGRLAAHDLGWRLARRALVAGATGIVVAPWLAPWLGGWLLPAGLPLDTAMPTMVRGSFVATFVLFAPAMACLGALSPLLMSAAVKSGNDVGRTAGALGAAGTIGSLVGTFAATHWLVPSFGCRMAMGLAGALLVAAACLLPRQRRQPGLIALLLVAVGAAFVPHGSLATAPDGEQLLAEVESRTQFLQVLRSTNEPAHTRLRINEGLDSFHSLAIAGSSFTGGAYYDWHALAPFLCLGGLPRELTVLSIGDAAGTLRTVYAAVHPGAKVDAVDVDGATMALGDAHFPGPKADGARHELDGRVFLQCADRRWHCLHVDAYAHQVYVPAHLASRQFFRLARERLHDGGVIACNVGALHVDDAVLQAIAATMVEVFGHARVLLVPHTRNALLIARRGTPPEPGGLAGAATHPLVGSLSAADRVHWQGIAAAVARPGALRDVGHSSAPALDDDRPVLDALLAHSYIARDDDPNVVPCNGNVDAAGAEAEAYAAQVADDMPAVLAAVRSSRSETAYLREQAGRARWRLRALAGAAAEYDAALRLAPDEALRMRVAASRSRLQGELEVLARADASAARNGWLQWLAIGLLPLAVLVLRRVA